METLIPALNRSAKIATLGVAISLGVATLVTGDEGPEAISAGQEKFAQYCVACHKDDHALPLLASPSFAIQRRYQMEYGKDREGFVEAIARWVPAPSEELSLMPGARARFGLMPSLPYPEKDIQAIADYLYDADLEMPQDCDPRMGKMAMRRGGAGMGKERAEVAARACPRSKSCGSTSACCGSAGSGRFCR